MSPAEADSTTDLPRLRVGVIGLGMAGGVMTGVVATHPRLRLVGAADPQKHLRDRFEADHGIPAQADAVELLEREDVDAVYIATPHQFHAEHVLLAARYGKHAVVEKPMALSLTDCDRMIAATETAGTVLIVGHTHGFDPAVSAIRGMIDSGRLGKPVLIHGFNYTNFLYRPRRPEELDPARGGGVLWNQVPHFLDIARIVAGADAYGVRAKTPVMDPERGAPGACSAFIEFDSGAAATFVYSGYDRFDSDEWFGWLNASGSPKAPSHGAAWRARAGGDPAQELAERQTRWSYGGAALAGVGNPGLPHFGHLIVSCECGDVRTTPEGLVVYDRDGPHEFDLRSDRSRPGHIAVWDELWSAVRRGTKPIHSGSLGRGTVALCHAIAKSAQDRREVLLAELAVGESSQ